MRDSLKNKCDLFADNYTKIYESFKWNYTASIRLGALLYTMEDRTADTVEIRLCKDLIKENTGVFSQFRDITNFMTAVMLSLQPEPEGLLKNALEIYHSMKKEGFHSSSYLVLAALTIAKQADPAEFDRIIAAAKSFYDAMKEKHPIITSSDDYGFASLLAMSGKEVGRTISDMEYSYSILKETFAHSNSVQALSQVLAFSDEDTATKCTRVVELYEAMIKRNSKIGSGIELSFLGIGALLNENADELAQEISEVKEYLKVKKGFGYWSISAKERVMFAIALVCEDYLIDTKKNTMELTLANNVANIVLAQQMAMMVVASSGAAAAASASAAH